jgi:hypothetical protein
MTRTGGGPVQRARPASAVTALRVDGTGRRNRKTTKGAASLTGPHSDHLTELGLLQFGRERPPHIGRERDASVVAVGAVPNQDHTRAAGGL